MLRWMATVAVSLALGAGAMAQTAKVVELSAEDAKAAAELYRQQAEINKKISELRAMVVQRYLTQKQAANGGCWSTSHFMEGFNCMGEFEFSTDFRFVVPARPAANPCVSFYTSPLVTPATVPWTNCVTTSGCGSLLNAVD